LNLIHYFVNSNQNELVSKPNMDDLNYYQTRLEKLVTKLEKKPNQKEAQQLTNKIKLDLEASQQLLLELENPTDKRLLIEDLNSRFQRALGELQFNQEEQPLFLEPKQLSAQQAIHRGDKAYQEAQERMQSAFAVTEQSKQVVGNIEQEVHRQDQVIQSIEDKTNDLHSRLKRSKRVLTLIYSRFLTDKLIACLILMVLVLIVFIVVYRALGLSDLDIPQDSLN